MAILLTGNDIAIIRALLKDGRKSFRQISREIGVSTPTVKSRFTRLLSMGIIKSVSPILDVDKLSYKSNKSNVDGKTGKQLESILSISRHDIVDKTRLESSGVKIDRGLSAKIQCDYCNNPLSAKMFPLKITNIERFFCCSECRFAYKKKYAGRIEAIRKRYYKASRHKG